MDPITLVMLAMIGLLLIFMVRNSKKRREQMDQMRTQMVPGAKVMLGSGIYGTIVEIHEEDNRVVIQSAGSTLEVHSQAVAQVVSETETPASDEVAPDDDPAFGENVSGEKSDLNEAQLPDDIRPEDFQSPDDKPRN